MQLTQKFRLMLMVACNAQASSQFMGLQFI